MTCYDKDWTVVCSTSTAYKAPKKEEEEKKNQSKLAVNQ
jgi:formiminotetrahydrofolate cyclodeaminase